MSTSFFLFVSFFSTWNKNTTLSCIYDGAQCYSWSRLALKYFLNTRKHKFHQQGGKRTKGTTSTASRWWRGGRYDIPRDGRSLTLLPGLSASHAPNSTYRSVLAQSSRSLPDQLALPSSSSSKRGGIKGLHVRNKKGGEVLKKWRQVVCHSGAGVTNLT